MKVLQIAPGYTNVPSRFGGAVEKHIARISEELERLGVDVVIAARRSRQRQSGIIYVNPPVGDRGILSKIVHSTTYSINLRPILTKKFDIIHIHGGIAGFIQSHLLPKKSKIVFTIHNLQLLSANPFIRGLASLMELSSCKHADAVIAVSRTMQRILNSKLKDTRVEYLPNGCDIKNRFVHCAKIKGELGLKKSKVILFVGRIIPEKGVHILIKAIKEFKTRYGIKDFKLVMVGPPGPSFSNSPSPYFHRIIKLVEDLNLKDSVEYIGLVDEFYLEKIYASADLFVFPSISEAMSLVVLEAMASGLPVVASRTGGIPDMIHHEETGILVPPGDPLALADAIYRVLVDTKLAHKLSKNAFRMVQDNYSWATIAHKIKQLYTTL